MGRRSDGCDGNRRTTALRLTPATCSWRRNCKTFVWCVGDQREPRQLPPDDRRAREGVFQPKKGGSQVRRDGRKSVCGVTVAFVLCLFGVPRASIVVLSLVFPSFFRRVEAAKMVLL